MSLLSSYLLAAAAGNQGTTAPDNWFVVLDNNNTSYQFQTNETRIILDSNGNPFVFGTVENRTGVGRDVAFVAKLNTNGELQEDKEIGVTNYHVTFKDAAIDSNDNIYMTFWYGSYTSVIAKIGSNNFLSWSRQTYISNKDVMWKRIAVDSSDNMYVTGEVEDFGFNDEAAGTLKIRASDGLTLWRRTFRQNADNLYPQGICIYDNNGTDEVFVAFEDLGGTDTSFILEYNTSGVLQNQYEYEFDFGGTEDTNFGNIVSNGTHLFVGAGIDNDAGIVKINPANGNVVDYVVYGGTNGSRGDFSNVALTPDGNYIYLLNENGTQAWLAKFSTSSLSLQWQRQITYPSSTQRSRGITATNTDVYISAMVSAGFNNDVILAAKLPGDGSGTGTYGTGDTLEITYGLVSKSIEYPAVPPDDEINVTSRSYTDSTSNVINTSITTYYQNSGIEVEQTNAV